MIKKIFLKSLKKDALLYFILVLMVCLLVVVTLLPAKILEYIVNDYLLVSNPEKKIIIYFAIAYLLVQILNCLFEFIKQLLLVKLGYNFTNRIRYEMALKLKEIDNRYFTKHSSSVIESRFINDVDAINSLFQDGILSLIIDLLKLIGIIVAMFLYSIKLGLLTILLIPFIFLITIIFKKKMYKAQKNSRVKIGELNGVIENTYQSFRMIKVFSKEDYFENKYENKVQENYQSLDKVSFYDSIYSPIIKIITAVCICTLIFFSYSKIAFLALNLGMLAGAIEYISSMFSPIENLGMELQTVQKAKAGLVRVREFLEEKEESHDEKFILNDDFLKNPKLIFDNVKFKYDDGDYILNGVSLSINSLEKCAFMGRTGVGKTTTFKLIKGNLTPTEGVITINGADVCDIPNRYKFLIYGYVAQNFKPIDGTIFDNITMKNKNLTIEDTERTLKIVNLKDKIESLEKGIYTQFNRSLFSQGELQLLSIARAIIANPPILLLDEITSDLDSVTEERVLKALNEASKNRMIIQITHRSFSAVASDKVFTFKDGVILDTCN